MLKRAQSKSQLDQALAQAEALTAPLSTKNWLPKRSAKNCVSSGKLPYQITKYCDQNKYIQKIENAKVSFPMSCMRCSVIRPSKPSALR